MVTAILYMIMLAMNTLMVSLLGFGMPNTRMDAPTRRGLILAVSVYALDALAFFIMLLRV